MQADKILLTNLFNFSQPFIRYEVTDRVIFHNEPCACGNPSPWIELEGRNDDVITFTENGNEIRVPPLAVYATLKEVHGLKRFQLVVRTENHMELRLEATDGISKESAFAQADSALRIFFQQYGIHNVEITLSPDSPRRHPGSGKFKHIVASGTQEADIAQYWRTRNGTADQHTSFSVAYDICLAAEMAGADADYSLVWAMGHGSNEGTTTGTFVDWINEICPIE